MKSRGGGEVMKFMIPYYCQNFVSYVVDTNAIPVSSPVFASFPVPLKLVVATIRYLSSWRNAAI